MRAQIYSFHPPFDIGTAYLLPKAANSLSLPDAVLPLDTARTRKRCSGDKDAYL